MNQRKFMVKNAKYVYLIYYLEWISLMNSLQLQ